MNVLMAASEMAPFAGTGGLAEAVSVLAEGIHKAGAKAGVVMPYYRSVQEGDALLPVPSGVRFPVRVGDAEYPCEVHESRAPNGAQVFFLARDEFFDRSSLYGSGENAYQDNAARFIFFCKGVIELARRMNPVPDILHAVDWQAALIPVFAKHFRLPCATVLHVRDTGFQGNFWSYDFALTNLPSEMFSVRGVEFFGSLNFLKGGILAADRVVLPGAIALEAAKTPDGGCGLDAVFREHAGKLTGIADGIDTAVWNPATDAYAAGRFDADGLTGKTSCRKDLLERLGLDPDPALPVFCVFTTEMEPDGSKLLLDALDRILAEDVRVAVLGGVTDAFEEPLHRAAVKHRGRLAWHPDFADLDDLDEAMRHRACAGADALLVSGTPGSGGTHLMEAMRYGVLPVARACGGLRDIVRDHDPMTGTGNGFVFYDATPDALVDAVRRTTDAFSDPALWNRLTRATMETDFSKAHSAQEFLQLYAALSPGTQAA